MTTIQEYFLSFCGAQVFVGVIPQGAAHGASPAVQGSHCLCVCKSKPSIINKNQWDLTWD